MSSAGQVPGIAGDHLLGAALSARAPNSVRSVGGSRRGEFATCIVEKGKPFLEAAG
jgi:hypothetical protein